MHSKFYECAVKSELSCRMFSFLVFWNSLCISDALNAGCQIHCWVFYMPFRKWQCHFHCFLHSEIVTAFEPGQVENIFTEVCT